MNTGDREITSVLWFILGVLVYSSDFFGSFIVGSLAIIYGIYIQYLKEK